MSTSSTTPSDTQDLRRKLRDYARETVDQSRTFTCHPENAPHQPHEINYTFVLGMRGELAGPLFVALQNVLTTIEALEAEASGPIIVSASDPVALAEQRAQKRALRRAALDLQLAIGRGLAG